MALLRWRHLPLRRGRQSFLEVVTACSCDVEFLDSMRFSILVSAVAIFAATAANAAPIGPVQMPKSTLDGAHNSNWDPSSVNRIESLGAKVASLASWYGPGFHGRRTANGEIYDQNALTAAHKSLPFGTRVRVTNLNNGKSVVVRINDDGPHIPGRVIDLSKGAASRIGMVSSGVAPVRLEVLR
jgi:rare lipoprotein A (peptidoglycan hydrolase)